MTDNSRLIPSTTTLNYMREIYRRGARVRLISLADDPDPVPSGTLGTVVGVDDAGSIMVDWDNGRDLSVLYGIDHCELVEGGK